jgi:calnexin
VSPRLSIVLLLLFTFLTDGLECGGAYMKLLKDNKALQSEEFSNASPYVIMFGPDKCGATNKVGYLRRSGSTWS